MENSIKAISVSTIKTRKPTFFPHKYYIKGFFDILYVCIDVLYIMRFYICFCFVVNSKTNRECDKGDSRSRTYACNIGFKSFLL